MKNTPSTSSSVPAAEFNSAPQPERIKIAVATEQRLYELACKARAKGMFCKIPPSHKRARAAAAEMIKVLNYEKYAAIKPLADLSEAHRVIKDLSLVKTEKLNQRPGYQHVMSVLREEFQNYSLLAHQRGFEEKGEIFQLISHFPKIGLILQRVNMDRPFRYDGVVDNLEDCKHNIKKEYVSSLRKKGIRVRITNPKVKKCEKCEQKVVDAAEEKLDMMHHKLEEEASGVSVDATLNPHPFEKHYKMPRSLVAGIDSHDYAAAIDCLRTIWNLDMTSCENRESMFKNRIRQQKLTAMVNIYGDKETQEELDEVVNAIDETVQKIQEGDEKTTQELIKLKAAFGGSWEKVRKNLGTTTGLSSDDRKIKRLIEKLIDAEEKIEKLEKELAKAKKRSDDAPTPSKVGRPRKDDEDRDRKDKKDKKEEKSGGYIPKRLRIG